MVAVVMTTDIYPGTLGGCEFVGDQFWYMCMRTLCERGIKLLWEVWIEILNIHEQKFVIREKLTNR